MDVLTGLQLLIGHVTDTSPAKTPVYQ